MSLASRTFGGGLLAAFVGACAAEAPAPVAAPASTPAEAPAPDYPRDAAALVAALPADAIVAPAVGDPGVSATTGAESYELLRPVPLWGVPCQAGPDALRIAADRWGCVAAEGVSIGPWTLRRGAFVGRYLGRDQLVAIVLADVVPPPASVEVDGLSCQMYLHFRADGSLESCRLAAGQPELPVGTDVLRHPDGRLSRLDRADRGL